MEMLVEPLELFLRVALATRSSEVQAALDEFADAVSYFGSVRPIPSA